MERVIVIAIAAVAGGGKTTVTARLTNYLENAEALYFDTYDFQGEPENICKWVDNGGDVNVWRLTPLVQDIKEILDVSTVKYLILDYPFAYLHQELKDLIDVAIFIDTPLDIAMARRIVRDFKDSSIEQVQGYMGSYTTYQRKAYLHMQNTVKPSSDFIIEGSLSAEEIVSQIVEKLDQYRSKS